MLPTATKHFDGAAPLINIEHYQVDILLYIEGLPMTTTITLCLKLTSDMTSLAKSLAKSGVTKQENPDNDTPASYIFILHRSCRFTNVIHQLSQNNVITKTVKLIDQSLTGSTLPTTKEMIVNSPPPPLLSAPPPHLIHCQAPINVKPMGWGPWKDVGHLTFRNTILLKSG